ncbi:hypothetical protein A3D05_03130 [Candidatus Gottesmanbacteria bacterium RIFCSPHIGHO2_02_FULL_40_24]|nr:MAG: hypothetical protein A3D05_03130 [Candidatus Gottesmanbacteria bacterium RIFCSPHIGHO2_02_FULL_40_24]
MVKVRQIQLLIPDPTADPVVSPSDGFDNAKRNVKVGDLSFGIASRYASGVAIDSTDPATFQLTNFTVIL